jgi:hypothetical protein
MKTEVVPFGEILWISCRLRSLTYILPSASIAVPPGTLSVLLGQDCRYLVVSLVNSPVVGVAAYGSGYCVKTLAIDEL